MSKHFLGCRTLSSVYIGTFCCSNFGQLKAQQKLTPVFECHSQLELTCSVFLCQWFTDVPSLLVVNPRLIVGDNSSLHKAKLSPLLS